MPVNAGKGHWVNLWKKCMLVYVVRRGLVRGTIKRFLFFLGGGGSLSEETVWHFLQQQLPNV